MIKGLTPTQIVNLALVKLGQNQITTIEGTSLGKTAQSAQFVYEYYVRDELEDQLWVFATKEATLARLAVNRLSSYGYTYQLPNDFLKLHPDFALPDWQLSLSYTPGIGDAFTYQIVGDTFCTNIFDTTPTGLLAPFRIRYISDDINPEIFPQYFVNLAACRIAFELAETLTQSNTKKAAAKEEYDRVKQRAVFQNAKRSPKRGMADGTWITGRYFDN
jgi:hypothetical protein